MEIELKIAIINVTFVSNISFAKVVIKINYHHREEELDIKPSIPFQKFT